MTRKILLIVLQAMFGCLLCCTAGNAQDNSLSVFTLADGEYSIESIQKHADREDSVFKSMPATVTVRKDEVLISTSAIKPDIKLKPLVGRLIGNKFKAQILLGAKVIGEFMGELVENDRIEGVVTYNYFNNQRISGTWTMKLLKY